MQGPFTLGENQMRNFHVSALIAMTLLSTLGLSELAMADKVMSQGDVQTACAKSGGESFDLSASYGCIASSGDKAVFCKKSDNSCTVVTRATPTASRQFFNSFNKAAVK
jgi:hypothetical protein